MTDMAILEHLIPSSPWVTGLIAVLVLGGTWVACRLMRFTDDDDE